MTDVKYVEMDYHKAAQMFVDMEQKLFAIGFVYTSSNAPCIPRSRVVIVHNEQDRRKVIDQFKTLTPEKVFSHWAKTDELEKYNLFVYTDQKKSDWDIQELIKIFEQVKLNSITFYVLQE